MDKEQKIKLGTSSRKSGKRFELETRHELERRGYTVCKWINIVDITEDKIIPAKSKFNPFTKSAMAMGGFPDFVAFKRPENDKRFIILGVESKKAKYLDQKEKRMCRWYLEHNTFSKLFVAYPLKNKATDKRKKGIAYYEVTLEKLK